MVDLAIIADDLTGALDAAAPFARRGIQTAVALHPGAMPEVLAKGTRIVSVSTASREIGPEEATRAVEKAYAALPPGTRIFKKVDSRLKGNIAAELDALPHQRSLTVAAIPEFGRIARNGKILGFGVVEPITILERLGRHASSTTAPDIACQDDIARALQSDYDLLIGARGLAEALARAMAPDAAEPSIILPNSAAYCVIGSTDPITQRQLERLREVAVDLADIAAPNGVAPPSATKARLTILQAVPGPRLATGADVAHALGASLRRLDPEPDAMLVLSGGATAQVILEKLGIQVLDVLGEALPGLPISRAGGLTVVTKSGGFGDLDCLCRLFASQIGTRSPVHAHVE